MVEYTEKIREIAKRLLQECKVDAVLGFRSGTIPMMNEPCFVREPEEVDRLIWDSNCGINLCNYLTDRKERIGVLAKGCDSRNIVTHIVENKVDRDQLYVIGVPCQGMIDKKRITAMFEDEVEAVEEKGDTLQITAGGKTSELKKEEVLQQNCSVCIHRNPVIHDEMVADPVPEQEDVDRYADVREIEAMSTEDRWAFFDKLLEPCIRCYACRNACPLCYCPSSFVD